MRTRCLQFLCTVKGGNILAIASHRLLDPSALKSLMSQNYYSENIVRSNYVSRRPFRWLDGGACDVGLFDCAIGLEALRCCLSLCWSRFCSVQLFLARLRTVQAVLYKAIYIHVGLILFTFNPFDPYEFSCIPALPQRKYIQIYM